MFGGGQRGKSLIYQREAAWASMGDKRLRYKLEQCGISLKQHVCQRSCSLLMSGWGSSKEPTQIRRMNVFMSGCNFIGTFCRIIWLWGWTLAPWSRDEQGSRQVEWLWTLLTFSRKAMSSRQTKDTHTDCQCFTAAVISSPAMRRCVFFLPGCSRKWPTCPRLLSAGCRRQVEFPSPSSACKYPAGCWGPCAQPGAASFLFAEWRVNTSVTSSASGCFGVTPTDG